MIHKEEEIVSQLTKLILNNGHIDKWIFKINGITSGRGIAVFDVHSSKAMKVIRSNFGKEPEENLC
jgi:DeoR/GlpR family transcriptional regulator of sugar metabolism